MGKKKTEELSDGELDDVQGGALERPSLGMEVVNEDEFSSTASGSPNI